MKISKKKWDIIYSRQSFDAFPSVLQEHFVDEQIYQKSNNFSTVVSNSGYAWIVHYSMAWFNPNSFVRLANNGIQLSAINFYYPTTLSRVQITREKSTNIPRYLYSS